MKILYAILYHSKFKMGGAEKVLLDLACSMKQDHSEEVACVVNSGDLAEELKGKGIAVTEIYWPKVQTFQTLLRLHQAIKTFQPDLIHSHHRYATFLLDLFFKRKSRILHTEHVLRQDKRGFFRCGHLVTAVHESIRENLIRLYRVPPEKVVTIPNAVRLRKTEAPKLQKIKEKYQLHPNQVFVLCIGRLEEQKGHRYLIEAVSRLPKPYLERLRIFLLGEGSLAGILKSKVREARLENHFIFLGHSAEVPEFLSFCDFLVLPSLWEGMPLVVLEAYSAGKPVVATDIPGTNEVVKPGETGLLVPPRSSLLLAKALVQMMDHPEQIKTMGAKAHLWWSEAFSYETMIHRYHELYQNLCRELCQPS